MRTIRAHAQVDTLHRHFYHNCVSHFDQKFLIGSYSITSEVREGGGGKSLLERACHWDKISSFHSLQCLHIQKFSHSLILHFPFVFVSKRKKKCYPLQKPRQSRLRCCHTNTYLVASLPTHIHRFSFFFDFPTLSLFFFFILYYSWWRERAECAPFAAYKELFYLTYQFRISPERKKKKMNCAKRRHKYYTY